MIPGPFAYHRAGSVDEAAGYDPHVWFSVANARLMVETIRDAFVAADGANAAAYSENARRYASELQQLQSELQARVSEIPAACRKLVTNHDVLGYYAGAFGFQLIGSIIPGTSTEASA